MSQAMTHQDALLKWVNSFPIGSEIKSLDDLNDGKVLAKVMADVDAHYTPPFSSNQDILKDVVLSLFKYIRTSCEDVAFLLDTPGLKLFTMGEVGVTAELVSTLLMAAISGPERAKYLGAIPQRFDPSVMSGLQQIIEERLAKIKSNKEALENNSRTPFDSELEFEQSMGSLLQSKTALEGENKRLKRKIEGMQGNMDRLQENHDQLREDYRMIEAQIDEVASRGDTKSMIDALRKDLQDREDHIASQEASLETSRVAKEKAQYEVEGLKAAADELIVAKDELRSVNRENAKLLKSNTDLEKKANMADHYRRKLETVRDYEGECAELKRINDELQEQCKDVARLRHQNRVHERRIEDFERALSTNESEIYELTMAKKTLADTNVHLHNKVSSLEFTINQIEESRNEMSPQADRQFGSLEDELAENKQEESDTMRIAALKAQVEVLKNNSSAAQENGTLRLKIDNLEHANKKLTEKGNEQFERLAVAEQQVRAILDKSTGEGTEAFTNLRKTFESVSEALATLQKQHDEAKTELEQVKRDLLDARTDLSAIEQEDIEALEALKNTQETLSFSLQNELKDLQQRYKNLDTDYQQQKSQLIDALLSKDELHKKQIEEQEDIAMAKRHKDGLAEQQRLVDDIKLKNEEQLSSKEAEIEALQARVKSMVEGGADPEQKGTLEQENFNLKREYSLMSTAWFDLTRRLQSNNVIVQRRADAPKSWLNKQRLAVNPTGRR